MSDRAETQRVPREKRFLKMPVLTVKSVAHFHDDFDFDRVVAGQLVKTHGRARVTALLTEEFV